MRDTLLGEVDRIKNKSSLLISKNKRERKMAKWTQIIAAIDKVSANAMEETRTETDVMMKASTNSDSR